MHVYDIGGVLGIEEGVRGNAAYCGGEPLCDRPKESVKDGVWRYVVSVTLPVERLIAGSYSCAQKQASEQCYSHKQPRPGRTGRY